MNADQKKRIAHEISNWKNACNCRAVQLTGDRMAAMLQELIDAPEPDGWLPGGFRVEHFAKDDLSLTDEANAERRFFVKRIEPPYHKDGVWFGATAGEALAKACAAIGVDYTAPPAPDQSEQHLGMVPADVARDAEPAAWKYEDNFGTHFTEDYSEISNNPGILSFTPLYTAPPAPSVPPVRSTGQWESSRIADYNRDWNACREAMLAATTTQPEPPADVAREADMIDFRDDDSDQHVAQFIDFLASVIGKAVAAEREACAKLCEQRKIITPEWQLDQHYNQGASHCAAAIRARGEKGQS